MIDVADLRNREAAEIEKVTKLSLLSAAERFDVAAEDPGWQSDMYDDYLRDAIMDAAAAIINRRSAESKTKKTAVFFTSCKDALMGVRDA